MYQSRHHVGGDVSPLPFLDFTHVGVLLLELLNFTLRIPLRSKREDLNNSVSNSIILFFTTKRGVSK